MSERATQAALLAMYKDWQQAQERVRMAVQSLQGAQADVVAKEARFKGAAELVHGKEATFQYNEKDGLKFVLPNRAQRRAAAKTRKRR